MAVRSKTKANTKAKTHQSVMTSNGSREEHDHQRKGRPIRGFPQASKTGHHDYCLRIAVTDPNHEAWCIEFDKSAVESGPEPIENDPWGRQLFYLKNAGIVVETRTTTVQEFIQSGCIIRGERHTEQQESGSPTPLTHETGEVGDPTSRSYFC